MALLTVQAALAIALTCPTLPASLAPIMVGIAQHESGLDTTIIHHNDNGTVDVGLAQVNSSNFGWLGMTMQTAMDPCKNLAAGARVLFARYNGNPPDSLKATYTAGIMANLAHGQPITAPTTPAPTAPEPPVVYLRPAHAGRYLIYSIEGN